MKSSWNYILEDLGLDIHSVLQLIQQLDEAAVGDQALQLPHSSVNIIFTETGSFCT